MGINGIPIQKVRIGEHDFRRPVCSKYCRMDAEFCPFVQNDRGTTEGIVRWTDIAEQLQKDKLGISTQVSTTDGSYTASFDGKPHNIRRFSGTGEPPRSEQQRDYEISLGKYTCWGDGSGLEYDLMPRNLVGYEQYTEDVYDIKDYGVSHSPLRFSSWNAWIDKAQYDQRFGRVSDMNAETVLFPNVDNPWMFTEYVFRGVGGDNRSGHIQWRVPAEYVVEPLVYAIKDNQLEMLNADLNDIEFRNYADGKYSEYIVVGGTTGYTDGSGGRADGNPKGSVRQFRQVAGWDRVIDWTLSDFGDNDSKYADAYNAKLLGGTGFQPGVSDAGIRLYHAKIPVQCVKWGEHGNIPPHTLDMTAPADYFETGKNILTMRAVYTADVGAPFYTDTHGIILWDRIGNQTQNAAGVTASVYSCNYQEEAYDGGKKTLKATLGDKIKDLDMPQRIDTEATRYLTPSRVLIGQQAEDGNVWAGTGCSNLYATISGDSIVVRCKVLDKLGASDTGRIAQLNENFSWEKCYAVPAAGGEHNAACEFNVPVRDYPAIAIYEVPVPTQTFTPSTTRLGAWWQQIVSVLKNNWVADVMRSIANLFKSAPEPTYSVKYEPVYLNSDDAKLTDPPEGKKYNEFFEGAQIVRDSGKYALEKRNEGLVGGDDTYAYNDISTRSFHRFFQTVMHCATQEYCNVFQGNEHRASWEPGKRADGKECPYYRERSGSRPGCPYNCGPKRAIEFAYTAQSMASILARQAAQYEEMTNYGCWDFGPTAVYKRYGEANENGASCNFGDWGAYLINNGGDAENSNDVLVGISVRVDPADYDEEDVIYNSMKWGGAALVKGIPTEATDSNGNTTESELEMPVFSSSNKQMFLCVFRCRLIKVTMKGGQAVIDPASSSSAGGGDEEEEETYTVHTHKVLSWYYWYQPLTDSGNRLDPNDYKDTDGSTPKSISDRCLPNLKQHVDRHGLWFCRFFWSSTIVPTSNCVQIDNDEKFTGGWHPEYKDYGRRGPEFMQEVFEDEEARELGTGDNVHNGDFKPVPLSSTTEGYWIDQSGEYILEEKDIGYFDGIAGNDGRESTGGAGTSPCISFRRSNTTVNEETGETVAPKTLNGAVYANDPYILIQKQYREVDPNNPTKSNGKKNGLRPEFHDPRTDSEYWAPCHANGGMFLPTMRHAWWCPECDYFLAYRYGGKYLDEKSGQEVDMKCPWCGGTLVEIPGSDGGEYWEERHSAEGKTWAEKAGHTPQNPPSRANPPKVITKFFKIHGIGNVDVWAPPGTSIKTDAYFWRRQTYVSNALRRQFYHRFGTSNKQENGGGYKFDEMSDNTEMTLGYPEMVGRFSTITPGTYKTTEKTETDPQTGEKTTTVTREFVQTAVNYDPDLRYSRQYIQWRTTDHAESDGMWNSVSPRHFIPGLYGNTSEGKEDEGVIAPYTPVAEDALKSLSYRQLWAMRNAVEPMFAYVQDPYSGGEFPTKRASYDDRLSISQNIVWSGHRSVVTPTVLATTDDGKDSYQMYFSGDARYGNVREYFPSGYTWWFMHQQLGGRFTEHREGRYHMDDKTGQMEGGSGGEYTIGDRTVAKCAMSIYGMLPLDKDIVKAYLILTPSGVDPSKDPVGFSWGGTAQPMWMHYHAKRTTHSSNGNYPHAHGNFGLGYDKNGNLIELDEDGYYYEYNREDGHTYGKDMWGRIVSIDGQPVKSEDEEDVKPTGSVGRPPVRFLDEGAARLWGEQSEHIDDDRNMYYEDRFKETMKSVCGLHDVAFYRLVGSKKYEVKSYDGTEYLGMGYDNRLGNSGLLNYNFDFTTTKASQRMQYVVVDDEGNLIEKYPDSVAWKKHTADEINDAIDMDTSVIHVTISDGTEEDKVSASFVQYGSDVHNDVVPGESQKVSGYFDMSWTNGRGLSHGRYSAEAGSKTSWDAPVIFQADSENSFVVPGEYSGGAPPGQTGTVVRAFDCTDLVRRLYNTRVDRDFVCKAGASKDDVLQWNFYLPCKLGTLEALDADVELQNEQTWCYKSNKYGYLLTDVNSYPDIGGDLNSLPVVWDVGAKYELSPKKSVFYVRLQEAPAVLSNNVERTVNFYKYPRQNQNDSTPVFTVDAEIPGGLTFQTAKNAASMLVGWSSYATVTQITPLLAKVESDYEVVVELGGASGFFGEQLPNGESHFYPVQDRVVSASAYRQGFHPSRLLGYVEEEDDKEPEKLDSKWEFSTFHNEAQSFVVDLLRAPLCSIQRDYRSEAGRMDYSGAKCPTLSCEAHTRGVAVAANLRRKNFDKNSSTCPLCGASLKGAPGAQMVPGDGLMTYEYDGQFDPDPFIKAVEIVPSEKTAFKVLCRYSESSEWVPLVDYDYEENPADKGHPWRQNFPICEGNDGDGMLSEPERFFTDDAKDGFGITRARFVKVVVEPKREYEYLQWKIVKIGKYTTGDEGLRSNFQIIVEGDFSDLSGLSTMNLNAVINAQLDETNIPKFDDWIAYWNESGDPKQKTKWGDPVKIVSSSIINEDRTQLRISLNREWPQQKIPAAEGQPEDTVHYDDQHGAVGNYIQFFAPKYYGGVKQFRVWGMHYKTAPGASKENDKLEDIDGEQKSRRKASAGMYLTITDPPDFYSECFEAGRQNKFQLPSRPTQILRVSVGKGEGGAIVLDPAPYGTDINDRNKFYWKTKTVDVTYTGYAKGTSTAVSTYTAHIVKIVGGMYYYNPASGKIILPEYSESAGYLTTGARFGNFEWQLELLRRRALKETDVDWDLPAGSLFLPDHITVTYWGGNGKDVTLPATAKSTGPSYMVEKNAINKIVKGSLPDNGKSCALVDSLGNVTEKSKIEWFCYNNEPAGLDVDTASGSRTAANVRQKFNSGEFIKPVFTGKELAKEFDNDQAFVNLFGDHAENCDRSCTTTVTFTGAPNQVLSGEYVVRAPAESVGSQWYRERTGGISQGFIIVTAAPESAPSGKTTICYQIPQLIIYAKERYPWQFGG